MRARGRACEERARSERLGARWLLLWIVRARVCPCVHVRERARGAVRTLLLSAHRPCSALSETELGVLRREGARARVRGAREERAFGSPVVAFVDCASACVRVRARVCARVCTRARVCECVSEREELCALCSRLRTAPVPLSARRNLGSGDVRARGRACEERARSERWELGGWFVVCKSACVGARVCTRVRACASACESA